MRLQEGYYLIPTEGNQLTVLTGEYGSQVGTIHVPQGTDPFDAAAMEAAKHQKGVRFVRENGYEVVAQTGD